MITTLVFLKLCDILKDEAAGNVILTRELLMVGEFLTGQYRVRAIRPAIVDVSRLCRRVRDNIAIRRHALKLRYWPEKHPENDAGTLLDLNWSWIKTLQGMNVGELRIDDTIAGNDNLRLIFFVGDSKIREPLPMIWILRAMQKKRQSFSKNDIRIFKARRLLVQQRFYRL